MNSANINFHKIDMWSFPQFLDSEGFLSKSIVFEKAREYLKHDHEILHSATAGRLWQASRIAIKTFGTIVLTRIAQIAETALIGIWAIKKGFLEHNLVLFLGGITILTVGTAIHACLALTSPLEGVYEAAQILDSGSSQHNETENQKLLFTTYFSNRVPFGCPINGGCKNPLHKVSARICALFTSLAGTTIARKTSSDYLVLPEGWKLLEIAYGTAVLIHGHEIVIAHHGMNFESVDPEDFLLQELYQDDLQDFPQFSENYKKALHISSVWRKSCNLGFGYSFTEIGYSWGGLYAELNAYVFNDKAITYDSPGAKNLLLNESFRQRLQWAALRSENIHEHSKEPSEDNYTSFVTAPNIVNTWGRHMGKIIRLHSPPAPQKEFMKTPQYHALDQLIKCFDPETGEPFQQSEITNWPTTKQYFSSFLKKEYWWDYLPRKIFQNKQTADAAHEHFLDHMPGYAVAKTGEL